MRYSILAACFLLAFCPGVAAGEVDVPLDDWLGKPIVELTIAGEGPFRFILDSGAEVTVIDHALAARFEFEQTGETEIGSPLGGTVPARRVELHGVRMGGVELGTLKALDIDLASLLGKGDAPVGVLATVDVGKRSLIFDFSTDRLKVSDALLPEANRSSVFDFCSASGRPSLNVQVGGKKHCVNLDTGSSAVLTLPLSTADSLPLKEEPKVHARARLVGAEVEVWGAQLDGELRIGSIVIPEPDLGFIATAPIGNLGQGFLRNTELTIDHVNQRLGLRVQGMAPQTGSAQGGPQIRRVVQSAGKKRYGIQLRGSLDAELRVAGVEKDSPAEAGGLLAGDLLVALNGVPVGELDAASRMAALRGSPLKLDVKRDGALRKVTLTLE